MVFANVQSVNLLPKKSSSEIVLKPKIGLVCTISCYMQLMMYIGNDLIEAVPLDLKSIPKPGYVGSFKRSLKIKYRELIQQFPEPPEFLVIEPITTSQARYQTNS